MPSLMLVSPLPSETASLCHLCDVRPNTSSLVFLFSRPFVEVLHSSTLRMTPSISRDGQSRCLSFWWEFCNIVWFPLVSSFSWDTLLNFLFHLSLFNGVRFQYFRILLSFLISEPSDSSIITVSKVKLAILVEGDTKIPFSIATTPRCRGGLYSVPWIAPLYLWSLTHNVEC